jgi:flagellar basal-body rod protein FlgC
MTNMMEASRSYQDSIEAMNTAKQLILRTLTIGR